VAYTDGENDFVVLDDLGKYGYSTTTRQSGLSFELCAKFLECLGRLHGLSLAFRSQKPEEFEELTKYVEETYYAARLKPWYNEFIGIQQNIARDAVGKEYPGTEYEEKLEQLFAGDLYDKMVELTHTRTKYAVFNHGDCWTPNFLLKYEKDGDVSSDNGRIIDFQLARYSSPALDISFFIYSCTRQDLRESHYDQLLQAYYTSAAAMIRGLGSNPDEIFPFTALQSEMKTFARFGVGMGIESIPFSLLNDEDTADLDSIQGEEMVPITKLWILKNIKDQDGRLRLADMFKHATQCGYLD
jgi:aminoglycoside/choline kinase family phosphotransferase